MKTISWFHTGAWLEKERLELALQREYFQEGPPGLLVPDTILPPGLSIQDAREAARALRGSVLRTEVYADDGTEKAELPYVITEQNQEVRLLQPARGENRYGVVFAFPRETVTVSTERNLTDPRVAHELTLDVDAYGNVTRQVSLVYARSGSGHQPEQTRAYATLTEASFVNYPGPEDLEEPDQAEHWYRLGVEVEQKVFEVTGLAGELSLPTAGNGLVDIDALRAALDELDPEDDLPFEGIPTSGVERRLLDHKQQVFYANNLTGPLALGVLESLALPYETYQLALTTGQVASLVSESTGLGGLTLNSTLLTTDGGYVTRVGGYWAPSGRVVFDDEHFYLPVEAIDPFGNHAYLEWDEHSILIEKTRDALDNETVAENDYRVLAPWRLTDPNLNRVEVAFDALGLVVKTALRSKEGSPDGDTLENPTTGLVYDLLAFEDRGEPAYVHTKAREEHYSENPTSRIQESYTYSDGFGRVVMTKVQAEPGPVPGVGGPVDPRWVGTGRMVFNNKGNPVKQYEPFFSATSDFEDEEEIVETGVTPILRYDSLDRLVQTDLPDGTLTRVVFDSWRQEEWDPNDTVLESEWYERRESPDPLDPEPSVPDERAAWLSAQHAETPTVTHLDTLGRPFLSVAHNKTGTGSGRVEAFYRTRTRLDIEGNTQAIYDAKQHSTTSGSDSLNLSGVYTTIEQRFDVLGRRLRVDSPDAGARLAVADAAGKPLRSWDSKGQTHWSVYDALQRPTHQWVHDGTSSLLVGRIVYGEALDPSGPSDNPASPSPAQALNLRGQAYLVFDSAGVVKTEEHDFKGNLLQANRRLTLEYTSTPDWGALDALTVPSAIEAAASSALSAEVFETETEYDALNRVILATSPTSATHPAPSITRPVYNEANLLEELHVAVRGGSEAPVVNNLDYNARGQRILCTHENGVTTEYTYDEKTFRLKRLETRRTTGNVGLQDLLYFYDAAGNITEVHDEADVQSHTSGLLFSGTTPVNGHGKYIYDALYRLTNAEGREHPGQQPNQDEPYRGSVPHPNDLTALERYEEEYEYDEVGNIERLQHTSTSTNWTRRYDYSGPNNRLTATSIPGDLPDQHSATYTYDLHGSMTHIHGVGAVDWDYADRLQHVDKGGGGEVYFTYDASGQRVRKVWEHASIIEERIYLGGYEIYRKWNGPIGDGDTTLELERETVHVMDDQRRIAMVETKAAENGSVVSPTVPRWRYQLTNHLDSAVLELDASAGIISYEEYHPYGSTAFHTAAGGAEVSDKRYRYTGKERDEETGLYYHGARYYAAWLGRWTAADPAGLVDGLNLYRYSRDNPINFSDPGGTQSQRPEEEESAATANSGLGKVYDTFEDPEDGTLIVRFFDGSTVSEVDTGSIFLQPDTITAGSVSEPTPQAGTTPEPTGDPPQWLADYMGSQAGGQTGVGSGVGGGEAATEFVAGLAEGAATSAAIGLGLGLVAGPVAAALTVGLLGLAAYSLATGGAEAIADAGARIASGEGTAEDFRAAGGLLGGVLGGRLGGIKGGTQKGGGKGSGVSGEGSGSSRAAMSPPTEPKVNVPGATGSGARAYSTAFETRLSSASHPGVSRARHFQEANESLLRAMEASPELAAQMRELGISLERTTRGLAPRTSPAGWTWHHEIETGVMRLVPRSQHTTGSAFWNILHPEGRGGYSIWGQ